MATTSKLTFEQYEQLAEPEGARYELDEGQLVMTPSATWWHNKIRAQIARRMGDFVAAGKLGEVTEETEFRLYIDTSRIPDVAFVTAERFASIDIYRSPIDGAPDLAVEIISPHDRTEETVKKIHQYLDAGCRSVWVIYPSLRLAEHRANPEPRRH